MKKIMVMMVMGMVAAASQATLIFYDDFSSPAGSLLGTTPDAGTTWNYKTNTPAGDAYKVVTTGLTAPSGFKPATGGAATKTADGNDSYSTYAGAPSATAGNSIYYSFLFASTQAVSAASTSGRITALGTGYGSDYATIRYDKVANDSFYKLSLVPRGTTTGYLQLTNQLALGSTHLVVVSYTYVSGTTNDIVKMWLDPDSSTFNAGTAPTATLTANGTSADLTTVYDSIRLGAQSGTPSKVMVDELRVGTTWADVTPIPEPATVGMIGLGAVITLLVRRMRT
jgi:hypothetical protein